MVGSSISHCAFTVSVEFILVQTAHHVHSFGFDAALTTSGQTGDMSSPLSKENLHLCNSVLKRLQLSSDLDDKEKFAIHALYNWVCTVSLECEVAEAGPQADGLDQASISYIQAYRDFSRKSFSGSRGSSSSKWKSVVAKVTRERAVKHDEASPELRKQLDVVDSWDLFDIFLVKELAPGRTLQVVSMALFDKWGLIERLRLPAEKLSSFLLCVEEHYNSNPYHNSIHAADVTQCLGSFIALDDWNQQLTDLELLALLLAAIVHDIGHPGVTNDFQVKTKSEAALLYNDISVNENGHCATAFQLLKKPENNIFINMKDEDFRFVRRTIVEIVLATDMACHSDLVKEFTALATVWGADLAKWEGECRLTALKFVLHACDLSNPARPQSISVQWADRILNEFWAQGDRERTLGLPVSPLCDKTTCNVPKCQKAFLEHIVTPVYEILAVGSFAPNAAAKALTYIHKNKLYWDGLQ